MQWKRAKRIDSELCKWEGYDSRRIKAVQTAAASSRKAAAFLAGAFVSPAALASSRAQRAAQAADAAQPPPREEGPRRELAPCKWCGAPVPDTDHLLWTCTGLQGRPRHRPRDPLQRRLAWPTGERRRADGDRRILEWAIHVRDVVLTDRCAVPGADEDEEGGGGGGDGEAEGRQEGRRDAGDRGGGAARLRPRGRRT